MLNPPPPLCSHRAGVTGGRPATRRTKRGTCRTSVRGEKLCRALGWCVAHAATRTAAARSDRVSSSPASFFLPLSLSSSSLLLPLAFCSFTKRRVSPSSVPAPALLFAPLLLPSSFPLCLVSRSGFPLPSRWKPPSRDGCGPAAVAAAALLTALRVCDCEARVRVCVCV